MTRPAARFWPALVFVIIGLDLLGIGALMYGARQDRSFAVEKDYYARAVRWDESRAARARSEALGWAAAAEVDAARAELVIRLTDRAGAPVSGVRGRVTAFHRAFPNQARELALVERADEAGAYIAAFAPERAGWWEVAVEASRGTDEFASRMTLDIAPPAAARSGEQNPAAHEPRGAGGGAP